MIKPFYQQPDFKNIRLLFLDVDGVINSRKTVALSGEWPCTYEEHRIPYKGKYLRYEEAFDKYSIQLINRVCEMTETFIVVSSSWRNIYDDLETTLSMFKEMGINTDYIIGRTDDGAVEPHVRGFQIGRFINRFIRSEEERSALVKDGLLIPSFAVPGEVIIDSYVIVDDLDDESVTKDQESHLVKTDDYEGLTLRDTLLIGQKLTYDIAFGINALQGKDQRFKFKN